MDYIVLLKLKKIFSVLKSLWFLLIIQKQPQYIQGTAQTGVIEAKNNYKLIAINVAVPFYSPGFIATISNSLAQNCIPVLVVSTYSKDYFIVQEKDYWGAIYELKKLGIKESKGE